MTTLLTPYGYRLHVHVYQYLSNGFLMNNIDEFTSPNFHVRFTCILSCLSCWSIVGAVLGQDRISATGLLLLLFSLHAGLYAVRNIPISAIIMSLVLGPLMTVAISPKSGLSILSSMATFPRSMQRKVSRTVWRAWKGSSMGMCWRHL